MLDELAAIAARRGCRALGLHTVTKTGNVLVFQRLGFHVVLEQADEHSVSTDGAPLTDAYMERPLD